MEASKRRRGRRTTFGRKKGSRKRKPSKKIKLFGGLRMVKVNKSGLL